VDFFVHGLEVIMKIQKLQTALLRMLFSVPILLALVFSILGVKPARAEMITLSVDFTSLSGWTKLGEAALDTGWLRLTPNATYKTGVVFYNTAYSTEGTFFDIRFKYATYGGTGGDGLTFFILDGSETPTVAGKGPDGLGYTGISGGIFGVGFNEWGAFGNEANRTNTLAIRGATSMQNPLLISVPTPIVTTGRGDAKQARITFANNKVSVWINGVLLIGQQALSSPLPKTVKFGFSGATGLYYNIHEVDDLKFYVTPSALYVKPNGYTDWPCGQDWVTACTLQTALTNFVPGQEIRVKVGIYKPTSGTERAATFQLAPGVAVYGGFSGDETTRDQRHVDLYDDTLLSGDIGTAGNNSDNSYHVVRGATDATLDGFTITGGNSEGVADPYGGGMYNNGVSNLTVTNVTFSGNSASDGGGMYNTNGSSPIVTNVTFNANKVTVNGGGMYNNGVSNPTVTNVTFSGNMASSGGGMYNENSNPTVTNVTFSGNLAIGGGGGMYNTNSSSPTVTNVTFSGNSATGGGGMFNTINSSPTFTNVTFSGNSADAGGGIFNSSSNPVLKNVILWGDTGGEISMDAVTVSYSVVQGGYSGTGNLSTDPKLGILGNYGGFTQTIPLLSGSSAIDTGNNLYCAYAPVNNLDQRGVMRPQGEGCDIGAFERDRAVIYYVKPNAAGNCASWQDACDLPTALNLAPGGSEIWVMKGTHKPTTSADRAAAFNLKSDLEMYGGFDGTETQRDQRSPATNITILSGDLKGNDNANLATNESTRSDNSYHVVTGATGAILDGFTITGGNANGTSPNDSGGGMYNNAGSPTVTNVIFEDNSATSLGAGMYNAGGSNPVITGVTFANNHSNGDGGGMANNDSKPTIATTTFSDNSATVGGGMYNDACSPSVTNVTFSGNSAVSNGGAMYNNASNPTVTNVTFSGNSAVSNGGGMYNNASSPMVMNVTFSGNKANVDGGGMYNVDASNPKVTNVTFSGNKATVNGGGMYNSNSSPVLKNVILWGDTGGEITGGTPTVSYSVVQNGYSGTGNLTTDPKLGLLGDYGGLTQTIPLLAGSSAVDAGDNSACPATDQNGVTRPSGLRCDIGAFELDLKKVEAEARARLKAGLEVRLALSPYREDNDFDAYVANFDYAAGLDRSYKELTLLAQINQADKDLRLARNLYGFLIAYNPDFRSDPYYTGNPPAGYTEPLCGGGRSKEDPNPTDPAHTGQVLDPVVDWCDFPARLRQTVREAAYLHMIFGQQFMADALGLQFSGTALLGAESAVRQEAARLDAAKYQYGLAESLLNESLDLNLGNGCYVSDYFTQSEWSLFSRAIEGQETAQHQLAVRLTYLDVPQTPSGPQDKRDGAVNVLRVASADGYIKLIGMAAGQTARSSCVIDGKPVGERPDGGLAAEMAVNLAETRRTANEMKNGRNIFGFDVTFTPARRYTGGACGTESAGLYQDAICAAQLAQQLQDAEAAAERDYNNSQTDLRTEVQKIQSGIDSQIAEKSGCETPDWACVSEQKAKLNQCLGFVNVYPSTDFDACINDPTIHNSAARQALLDLRSVYMQQYSIYQQAININARIQLSNDANATVTKWLGVSGGFETAARATESTLNMISCLATAAGLDKMPIYVPLCGAWGGINIGFQATAGALSTAADVEIENANNYKETKNLLLDQQELLIDAYGASQQFASKYSEYRGLLDSLDDDVLEAQRQRAYFASSPANDPSYRIVLDSTRLQFASQLDLATKLTYLAARRAEYEYGARLNASNIRFSDIYRARTAGDLLTFLNRLNSVTSNLPAGIPGNISAQDLTYSVAQNLVPSNQTFNAWVADHTKSGVLKFTLNTASLKDGGLIANIIPQGYDGYWLITIGGIGSPKPTSNGLSVNLVSNETGLGYRAVRVTQGGELHLRSQAGCDFDYRLIAPAFLLGLDWPANQDEGSATTSFRANVNRETPYTNNGMRTEAFQGRALASTDWTVEIFLGPPAPGMKNMDLSELTDIELNFSIIYASRTPGEPAPSACTRIDW
jgi:predicted outer membrane repeat protein